MAYYNFVHSFGLHSFDLPALVLILIMVITLVVHHNKQAKRDEQFEKEMKGEAAKASPEKK